MEAPFLCYWGKASTAHSQAECVHLLPLHCLDVAAVADAWLREDPALLAAFARQAGLPARWSRVWAVFFCALHDLGKFDVRFQLKAPSVARSLNPLLGQDGALAAWKFDHGDAGLSWFQRERSDYGLDSPEATEWMKAVAGHHGRAPIGTTGRPWDAPSALDFDKTARHDWVRAARSLLLDRSGVASPVPAPPGPLLAGFCSVSDWLGSNEAYFPRERALPGSLADYFDSRVELALRALRESGLLPKPVRGRGMTFLYPDWTPRGVQDHVDGWPLAPALALIEAPTGSGKTEAALAYASRLLAAGSADSILFALPTQATANAMLDRLHAAAQRLFADGPNVVLAHGKARHHPLFKRLRRRGTANSPQGREEATCQCSQWIAQSRKRVFLGQVGVCTVDQVLLSVLPVRHSFVRTFGIGRSVLIVDEVHAYDSYMSGLLDRVLHVQSQAGATAILLSATLPSRRRKELLGTYSPDASDAPDGPAPYPAVTIASKDGVRTETVTAGVPPKIVSTRLLSSDDLLPPPELLGEIRRRASDGELVVVICNLVAASQGIARSLRPCAEVPVDLFHSRFRFCDRQRIEAVASAHYGKSAARDAGRILVATQVVEQSLDLDFDWMVTQLCPVDLLFQRLGRLHRHERPRRAGPECIVLTAAGVGYGLHQLVYGSPRLLWRTEQLVRRDAAIRFPGAYRDWIEAVYGDAFTEAVPEPQWVRDGHERFLADQQERRQTAEQLWRSAISPFEDAPDILSLTRGNSMALGVVPVLDRDGERFFLTGDMPLSLLPDTDRAEALDSNTVPVPSSWRRWLRQSEGGLFYLPMIEDGDGCWRSCDDTAPLRYSLHYGLERQDQ